MAGHRTGKFQPSMARSSRTHWRCARVARLSSPATGWPGSNPTIMAALHPAISSAFYAGAGLQQDEQGIPLAQADSFLQHRWCVAAKA